MKQVYLKLLVFALLFGILGYFREFFFMNVNNLMYNKYYHDQIEIPPFFSFLERQSYMTIYYLKYIFTALSFFLFFLLSYVCLKTVTQNKLLLKWLTVSYVILAVLSMLAMLWGYFVKQRLQDDEYTFSRWLMGIAQSPLPLLFMLAADKLNSTKEKTGTD